MSSAPPATGLTWIEFPIRRHAFTLVVFLALVAFGAHAWLSIPRSEDPYFPISTFIISVVYPGADAIEIERMVAKPIEDRLSELEDVKQLESISRDGVAVVTPEFHAGVDVERKYEEVLRELDALRPTLPVGVRSIEVRKVNPGLVNIVQFALVSGEAPYRELEDQARRLRDMLKRVAGVRTAETWAIPERELRVAVDLERLAEYRLDPARVAQALESENGNVPGGSLDIGPRQFALKTSGPYRDLEQIRNTVVATVDGRSVRVRDVAEVEWATAERRYLGRFNGARAVFVTASQKDGHNIFRTRAAIEAVLLEFEQDLPPRIRFERGFDQSRNVAARLNRLGTDFAIAIALVSLTLLPLGLRAAGVVMVSIPLSLAIGLAGLHALGFSLNQLSIAGFVVALGLLVDDSIVVVENIARHRRAGLGPVEAAIEGTRQITVAVLGCTATLIFAFLPLLALPGNPGLFIRSLPASVLLTILASLLVALTIVPFLASRVLSRHEDPAGNRWLRWVQGAIQRFYRPGLRWTLAHPRSTVALAIALFLASLALIPVLGFSLFPKADTPQFLIRIEAPRGSSLEETGRALDFVEAELARHPEVRHWFANLGRGNPQIYYNVQTREQEDHLAELFVELTHYHPERTPAFLDHLRARFATYANARIAVREFENGPPIDAPIAIRIAGPELDQLKRLAAEVAAVIEATPGTRDVDDPLRLDRTDLRLTLDPEKAALLGVPTIQFDRTIRLAVAGQPVGQYTERDGESYDIVLRTPIDERPTLAQLEQVRIPSQSGTLLPLSQLARLEFDRAPAQIQRVDRERTVTVTAYTATGYNTDRVTRAVLERLATLDWPRGYGYRAAGEVESRSESFQGLGAAALVALFGILAVLVLEFGDFRSTLIVATVIPLGIMGGLVALLLAGYSLSFTALIGFIALIGIEIKNSILLVDFTNQLRQQGVDLDAAIEQAGEVRFLPVLLTSVTAIGGLTPLAVQGSAMYAPMAWVMIGGLLSSTLLARLVTPVMYKLLPPPLERAPVARPTPPSPARPAPTTLPAPT